MKTLELSTKRSIHKPIKVVVDGKTYTNNPLSREMFEEIEKYDKEADEGKLSAIYKQVQLLFPIPSEVLDKLDIRDVNSLLTYATEQILGLRPKTEKEKAEKNAPKPGADASAS